MPSKSEIKLSNQKGREWKMKKAIYSNNNMFTLAQLENYSSKKSYESCFDSKYNSIQNFFFFNLFLKTRKTKKKKKKKKPHFPIYKS